MTVRNITVNLNKIFDIFSNVMTRKDRRLYKTHTHTLFIQINYKSTALLGLEKFVNLVYLSTVGKGGRGIDLYEK